MQLTMLNQAFIKTIFFLLLFITSFWSNAQGNSGHATMHTQQAKGQKSATASYEPIFTQALSDSGLINKEVKMALHTLQPGYSDTVSHRHGCEVLIYVQEGALEYREGNKPSVIYKKGQVLREVPYSLHTLHKNPSNTESTKLLLIFLYTQGKPTYLREYPEAKK
jgi:quercetin dioxygenase-like cupin family protein